MATCQPHPYLESPAIHRLRHHALDQAIPDHHVRDDFAKTDVEVCSW
jgi:hypothetical protein